MIWAAFWSVTEPALAIGNSCAPMLRPVAKAAFPRLFGSENADYYGKSDQMSNPRKLDKTKQSRDTDGEIPLTRLEDVSASASMNDGSMHEQSQDGCEGFIPHRPKSSRTVPQALS